MDIVRESEHELIYSVFTSRHEAGVRAMHELLTQRRAMLNQRWPGLSGDDLLAAQGSAREIDKLLRIIEKGPTISKTERVTS
ncbi:MAG: hypothetical protein ACRESC_07750 [Gammaproteobacteria bacterium]